MTPLRLDTMASKHRIICFFLMSCLYGYATGADPTVTATMTDDNDFMPGNITLKCTYKLDPTSGNTLRELEWDMKQNSTGKNLLKFDPKRNFTLDKFYEDRIHDEEIDLSAMVMSFTFEASACDSAEYECLVMDTTLQSQCDSVQFTIKNYQNPVLKLNGVDVISDENQEIKNKARITCEIEGGPPEITFLHLETNYNTKQSLNVSAAYNSTTCMYSASLQLDVDSQTLVDGESFQCVANYADHKDHKERSSAKLTHGGDPGGDDSFEWWWILVGVGSAAVVIAIIVGLVILYKRHPEKFCASQYEENREFTGGRFCPCMHSKVGHV